MTDTKALTLTERVISHMLKENTGRHMLDSGGAYGRHWERNQDRDFKSEPASEGRFRYYQYGDDPASWEIEYEINVFHYLSDYLVYDRRMTREFKRYAKTQDEDESWFSLIDEFTEMMHEGKGKPQTCNTCNGESHLSQVLQYIEFEVNDVRYIALSIHGGCDVRSGYTEPRIFTPADDDGEYSPFHWRHSDNPRFWCSDIGDDESGYWDERGSSEDGGEDLSEIPVTNDESLRGQGYLYVSPDGKMYHHITGAEIVIDGWERGMD